jgi:hypothetical protein
MVSGLRWLDIAGVAAPTSREAQRSTVGYVEPDPPVAKLKVTAADILARQSAAREGPACRMPKALIPTHIDRGLAIGAAIAPM